MNYCEKCYYLTENERCPYCKNKHLRLPQNTDYCFLVEKKQIFAQMLIEALINNGIEATYKTVLGAGIAISVGPTFERYKVFVPYERFEDSKVILEGMFTKD